jgi:hypothetical protein
LLCLILLGALVTTILILFVVATWLDRPEGHRLAMTIEERG